MPLEKRPDSQNTYTHRSTTYLALLFAASEIAGHDNKDENEKKVRDDCENLNSAESMFPGVTSFRFLRKYPRVSFPTTDQQLASCLVPNERLAICRTIN